MDLYPKLQSGFIASDDKRLSKPDSEADLMADYILLATHLKVNNPYFFSKELTTMFYQWKAKPEVMRVFSFREQVLTMAKSLFSFTAGSSLVNWLKLQEDKPTVSEMHIKFLIETLNFILGYDRNLACFQWFSLLSADSTTLPAKTKISNDKNFIDHKADLFIFDDALQLWVSKPHGFEDLLMTMMIIFGERTAITTSSFKHPS